MIAGLKTGEIGRRGLNLLKRIVCRSEVDARTYTHLDEAIGKRRLHSCRRKLPRTVSRTAPFNAQLPQLVDDPVHLFGGMGHEMETAHGREDRPADKVRRGCYRFNQARMGTPRDKNVSLRGVYRCVGGAVFLGEKSDQDIGGRSDRHPRLSGRNHLDDLSRLRPDIQVAPRG